MIDKIKRYLSQRVQSHRDCYLNRQDAKELFGGFAL